MPECCPLEISGGALQGQTWVSTYMWVISASQLLPSISPFWPFCDAQVRLIKWKISDFGCCALRRYGAKTLLNFIIIIIIQRAANNNANWQCNRTKNTESPSPGRNKGNWVKKRKQARLSELKDRRTSLWPKPYRRGKQAFDPWLAYKYEEASPGSLIQCFVLSPRGSGSGAACDRALGSLRPNKKS